MAKVGETGAQRVALGIASSGGDVVPVDASNPLPVGGGAANGAPVSGNPTLVAGSDGTNARTIRTGADGTVLIGGNVSGSASHGATDGGAPVKIGGFASSAVPTAVANGQRVNGWYGLSGNAATFLTAINGAQIGANQAGGDSQPRPVGLDVRSWGVISNGSTGDTVRSASAADATTGTGLLGAGILGQYTDALPTYTNGQFGTLAMTNRGVLRVVMADTGGNPTTTNQPASFDGVSATAGALVANSRGYVFNGTGWDRARGDTSGAFIGANQYWTESGTALAANITFNGSSRGHGGSQGGVGSRFCYFVAEAFSDVAGGTLYVDKSTDGTNWRQVGSIALAANTSVSLRVPISATFYRARVVNGATPQTVALVTTAFALN